ncbi:hypothetical protein CEXT_223871 [Caerostris extrusa]|uniref:Uncharacterized protein n=1 Tax=Caerostris extrusa TaxID=172846 RepID=A0AAV4MUL1_CAEEX|nr:hypothetical protein CEXT_223871 [Caerostris extrusa]
MLVLTFFQSLSSSKERERERESGTLSRGTPLKRKDETKGRQRIRKSPPELWMLCLGLLTRLTLMNQGDAPQNALELLVLGRF